MSARWRAFVRALGSLLEIAPRPAPAELFRTRLVLSRTDAVRLADDARAVMGDASRAFARLAAEVDGDRTPKANRRRRRRR